MTLMTKKTKTDLFFHVFVPLFVPLLILGGFMVYDTKYFSMSEDEESDEDFEDDENEDFDEDWDEDEQ